jgi:hypothetical protein
MGQDDISRFYESMEKYLRGDYTPEERHKLELRKARAKANAKRIIDNCGGHNPLIGN